ncbi:lyase family protein [Litorisediminicola beolgyonensis]|uniref:Lyase family protein n=1 Tax=Litorisediminicola beolgyonensis TaxID=1173614 RepID=A0ABW3ZHS6_9RHOB
MAASIFDSAHLGRLVPTGETGRLFSDSAEIRAMMIVEGTLAQVQGRAGIIPELSARAIHRASLELQIDPSGLAEATGTNGVSVPALVAAFRDLMQAPEHAQYVHWGATSQDIIDTALMLRLRQVLAQFDEGLRAALSALARLAEAHAETPMAARTYGQHATPTSFGAVAASWGWPLLDLRDELAPLRARLCVSLAGAAGTAAELGDDPAGLRADFAEALGLADPGRSWHADRGIILALASWVTRTVVALSKMGEDLILATQSGVAEVRLGGAGGSSTMPQKQNPVAPSVLVALAKQARGHEAALMAAGAPRQSRDGAAWFTEWIALPPLCLSLAAALHHATALAETLSPDADAMRDVLDASQGLLAAERLSFALTDRMPRPEAQAEVKALCKAVVAEGGHLRDAALARWPDLDPGLFDAARQMGQAPSEARAFVAKVRSRG